MTSIVRSFVHAACAALLAVPASCAHEPPLEQTIEQLVELSKDAHGALMRGDAARYLARVTQAEDFTLMSPFGGKPTQGAISAERMREIGKVFRNGSFEQELVHAYGSRDIVVLALIERQHVEVGGLPAQDWALRVTLVYRREGDHWTLAHRHADPLAYAISLEQSAALARGAGSPAPGK